MQQQTSDTIRKLMRLVVTDGYGKPADIAGYFVGGKTGTAEKVGGHTYRKHANVSAFMSVFPMNAPRYAVYFMLDEPHGNKSTGGYSTAGAVSAPAAGRVIAKIAPMLGLLPDIENIPAIQASLAIPLQPPHGYVSHWTGPLNFVPPSVPLGAPARRTAGHGGRPHNPHRAAGDDPCPFPARAAHPRADAARGGKWSSRWWANRLAALRSGARRLRLTDMLRAAEISVAGVPPVTVTGLTADSRAVAPGFLFAALPGAKQDGRRFIADAVGAGRRGRAGARGHRLAARGAAPAADPPCAAAAGAGPAWRRPRAGAQPATVVAVTGTNGKTSTADFLRQLVQPSTPAASLGTLGVIAPGRAGGGGLTTPDPVALAQTLAELARDGVQFAALEASSHGLDQYRLDGVRFAAAGFTNLTRDHLDYHGSLDAYRAAKLRLFAELLPAGAPAIACTALDPETTARLREIAAARRLRLAFVGENGDAIRLLSATPQPHGQALELLAEGRRWSVTLALPGRFQADNALLAAALAQATGTAAALDRLPGLTGVRGRMELAATLPNGAAVYVDYAHTPDALERLLTALRPHAAGRLHVVFGAGGDRDRGKRPLMGDAARRLADAAIITDDNPRSEDPAAIRARHPHRPVRTRTRSATRAAAIAAALNALAPGDVLAVAGKGHEGGQTIAATTLPFDDVATVRRLAGLT